MKFAIKLVLSCLLLGARTLHAALSVTVSPPMITNDYVGTITLSISNLSSTGAKVRVDRFLDVNGNGVVDGNEWSGQSFYVTDGQLPVIGGIRNSNVPGDDDSLANQSIQTHVPYPNVNLTLDHIAGQYIYRVTDLGNSQTATALLRIEQAVLPQGVSGQVFAQGGAPLGNAPVVVTSQNGNNGFGTVSDSGGHFTIYAPPGNYGLICVYAGQIAIGNGGVTIGSGDFATNYVTNVDTDGTTISGQVTDSVSAEGLPGIAVQAQTTNGLFVYIATGPNGDYTLAVNTNNWSVKLSEGEGTILGYCRGPVTKLNADASSGSVSGQDFQLIKGNALVYGSVMTTQTNPVPGVTMQASDTNNVVFDSEGLTDKNGNYSEAIVAGGDDTGIDGSDLTGYLSPSLAFFTVNAGSAVQKNFVLQPVSAFLIGRVQDNLGNPIGNLNLYADPTNDPSGSLDQNFQSAADGTFSEGVGPGAWNLAVECNTANSDSLISPQLTFTVTNGESLSNIVLVAQRATASIYGRVTDMSNNPLAFVTMFANATLNGTNYVSGCDNTDSNGNYSMLAFPAEWTVGGNFPGMANQNMDVSGAGTSNLLNFVVSPQSSPVTLSHPFLSGGQIQFQILGNTNQNYRVDVSSNLLSNGWTPVSTNLGSSMFTNAVAISNKARFYRAVAVP